MISKQKNHQRLLKTALDVVGTTFLSAKVDLFWVYSDDPGITCETEGVSLFLREATSMILDNTIQYYSSHPLSKPPYSLRSSYNRKNRDYKKT